MNDFTDYLRRLHRRLGHSIVEDDMEMRSAIARSQHLSPHWSLLTDVALTKQPETLSSPSTISRQSPCASGAHSDSMSLGVQVWQTYPASALT